MKPSDLSGLFPLFAPLLTIVSKIFGRLKILKIVIDYVSFYETAYLNLINQSNRSITVVSINMEMDGEPVPYGEMFTPDEEEKKFPLVIQENTYVQMQLSEVLSGYILGGKSKKLAIKVFDVEGKVYSNYKTREVDGKFGYINKKILKK